MFEYDIITGIISKKVDFNGALNGAKPKGSLMQASNGKLYGFTSEGGTNGYGVVFEYNPATNLLTKIFDYNNINGARPLYGHLLEVNYNVIDTLGCNALGIFSQQNLMVDFTIYPNPSNGSFLINSNSLMENTLVIIYDVFGKEVYQQKVINTTETIDTKLSNGIYFLKILSNEGYRTQKIIINK